MNKFGRRWKWAHNYAYSEKGRIWIAWQPSQVGIQIHYASAQMIHCLVNDKTTGNTWWWTVIYGLHTVEDTKSLWLEVRDRDRNMVDPWCLMGDFNAVLSTEDRVNGLSITNYETQNFEETFRDTDLSEFKSCGQFFSWSNKGIGDDRICSRIDRCLVNPVWITKYSNLVVE